MAPKGPKAAKAQPKAPEPPKNYPTIAAELDAEYEASRPYQALCQTKGFGNLTTAEKTAYVNAKILEDNLWVSWTAVQQKEFWKAVEQAKIPTPLPKPKSLGKDSRGVDVGSYTPAEYKLHLKRQSELQRIELKSQRFRQKRARGEDITSEELDEERNRRKLIGNLRGGGKRMGKYEGDPVWDDVVPIPQNDGEGALAAIAYSDEYAEAMGYLRAVMAVKEYSPRVLDLTEHIIDMNPAHYTVWLYRASTILALNSSIENELSWVNEVALDNQKNYQIWHHRQLLIDRLYSKISSDPAAVQKLADSEVDFMTQMFDADGKNYHVWSYRQYLVRKLNLFNDAELESIELLLRDDIRNNSAWSHRFFVVFSDPKASTPGSKATEHDPKISDFILDREIEFCKAATFEAPQNPSPWNYLRGVLNKGGRKLETQECFASEFVKIGEEEDVRSSHALDFLADVWAEKGETEKAERALTLLGEKYDQIRRNYWEWRKVVLKESKA